MKGLPSKLANEKLEEAFSRLQERESDCILSVQRPLHWHLPEWIGLDEGTRSTPFRCSTWVITHSCRTVRDQEFGDYGNFHGDQKHPVAYVLHGDFEGAQKGSLLHKD